MGLAVLTYGRILLSLYFCGPCNPGAKLERSGSENSVRRRIDGRRDGLYLGMRANILVKEPAEQMLPSEIIVGPIFSHHCVTS
jgi:hypothetical protein